MPSLAYPLRPMRRQVVLSQVPLGFLPSTPVRRAPAIVAAGTARGISPGMSSRPERADQTVTAVPPNLGIGLPFQGEGVLAGGRPRALPAATMEQAFGLCPAAPG